MGDAIALSVFVGLAYLVQVVLYHRYDVSIIGGHQPARIPRPVVVAILSFTFLSAFIIAAVRIRFDGPSGLQPILIIVFTLSWALNLYRLIPARFMMRLSIALGGAAMLLALATTVPSSWVQSAVMAGSLLWIGPYLFRRYRIPRWVFFLALLILMGIDLLAARVFVPVPFVAPTAMLDGLLVAGSLTQGIGDLLLGYLIICATVRYEGRWTASVLAVLLVVPLVIWRALVGDEPSAFPYYAAIVPVTFAVYGIRWIVRRTTRRFHPVV